jgi:hypothetical protein
MLRGEPQQVKIPQEVPCISITLLELHQHGFCRERLYASSAIIGLPFDLMLDVGMLDDLETECYESNSLVRALAHLRGLLRGQGLDAQQC